MNRIIVVLVMSFLAFGCEKNHKPVISDITCTPETGEAGIVFTLTVNALDEDGDSLSYLWKADGGTFLSSANARVIQWNSPLTGGNKTFTMTAAVSDQKEEVSRDFQILLEETALGSVKGHVYFTGSKIPVPEATVTAGDQSATTDTYGYFAFPQLPVDHYTITASKQDFGSFTSTITVIRGDTLDVTAEITSAIYTVQLSGVVTDLGGADVGNARIAVLDPDGTESKLITTTDETGYYLLPNIPLGERTLCISKAASSDYRYVTSCQQYTFNQQVASLNLSIEKVGVIKEFTDPRNNHVYQYKNFGSISWMLENLAYLPKVSRSENVSYNDAYYYVYDYQGTDSLEAVGTDSYQQYGVLYNMTAAKTACPDGWHLPSSLEWSRLNTNLGTMAGKKLKAKTGWSNFGNGDNSSEFSAIPGGMVTDQGVFDDLSDGAHFWTSTPDSWHLSFCVGLFYYSDDINYVKTSENTGASVRCVK